MNLPLLADWKFSPSRAMELQRELTARVIMQGDLANVSRVAGIDVGFEGEGNAMARAAVVVLKFPELTPLDYSIARMAVTVPYIPGLLAFREIPVIWQALQALSIEPDVFIVDGQGRAHPRRLGIASHLGVLLDRPTIGCAKSILCGKAVEPKNQIGAWSPLIDHGETIGAAVRMRKSVTPVYVSVGHRSSLERAVELVLACGKGYRLPETTRYAHNIAGGAEIQIDPEARVL